MFFLPVLTLSCYRPVSYTHLSIKYVDGNGNTLSSDKKAVSYSEGSISVTAPSKLEASGKKYILNDNATKGHVYGNGDATITFEYKEDVPEPYNIQIVCLDLSLIHI